MNARLRVFISSTERDLVNERAELAARLEDFNFQPVTSSGILPNGQGVWDRLRGVIQDCDAFVLILGDSYGEVPRSGPLTEQDISVTHGEYLVARDAGLPIFVFSKVTLGGAPPSDTEDARRQAAFREQVEDFGDGYYRTTFTLARELADLGGHALISFLTDHYQAARIGRRRSHVASSGFAPRGERRAIDLPDDLVEAVSDGSAVLLLGAGASLQAGLPSAAAFIEAMIARIRAVEPGYVPSASGSLFNAVATDFDSLVTDQALPEVARDLLDPPYAQTTDAHRAAARLFRTIVTTNYDLLLERATQPGDRRVVHGEIDGLDFSAPVLIKLHGSIDAPADLVLTEPALANLELGRPRLWAGVQEQLRRRPLLSVGSSLRDPSLLRLLESCRPDLRGWAVLYGAGEEDRRRLRRYGLSVLDGDADQLLGALELAVDRRRGGS